MIIIDYACKVDCRVQACMVQQGSSLQEMQQSLASAAAQMLPGQPQQQFVMDYQGMPSPYQQIGCPTGNPSQMRPVYPQQQVVTAPPYPQGGYQPYDPAQMKWVEQLQAQTMREMEKDRQAALRADAYSEAVGCSGKTLVDDSRGNVHCILDLEIKKVRHIMPDLLHKSKGYYEITFSNNAAVIIGDDEFYKAGRLLDRISQGTGRKVRIVPTKYRTTELLRETILSMTEELAYPFYVGWQKGRKWEFILIWDRSE